ncbi:MAG: 16S rRNA processing protein RimM [Oscillospiraceae bacterium]|nr:16S rRNA processing protein RimM [Oscillospiraceae bacterium]
MENLLEAGRIINTHGVRGEVKIEPWADSPAFFTRIKTLYLDSRPVRVACRPNGRFVIAKIEGVDDMTAAEALKTKIVYLDRADAPLEDGAYFIADLIGFTAVDENGAEIGRITDVFTVPAGDIMEIRGESEHLVPLRPEFMVARDMEKGIVTLRLIEGM